MSADFITSRVEINGPRHIWGPICLSYHSSVCWLWLFGSCHWDSGWACSVIDQALLTDRWSMVVGGAMDLSFSILSSSLFSSLCSPLVPGCDVYDVCRRCTGWLTRAGWEIVTRTGVWHGRYKQTLLFALSPFSVQSAYYAAITMGSVLQVCCMKTQPINNIRKSSLPPGRSCCLIHHWHVLVPEWPPWEKQSMKAPERHPVRIRVIFSFKEVIQWFCIPLP